jgi:hypothetical protein
MTVPKNHMFLKEYLEIHIVMARRFTGERLFIGSLHPGLVRIELNRQEYATARIVYSFQELIG